MELVVQIGINSRWFCKWYIVQAIVLQIKPVRR